MNNSRGGARAVPDKLLQLPRLNHSVRQISVPVPAVLCVQLKHKRKSGS